MTDLKTIKKIGYTQAFKAITIGLAIAYFILASMDGPFWLFQLYHTWIIIFAAMSTYLIGYYFGGLTGIWIFKNKSQAVLFGIIGGFLIVWCATFIGSLVGFVQEGLPDKSEMSEPFHDYIYKPMAIVTVFGFLPIVLVGVWFGLSIKKRIEVIQKNK